jgi:cytochrome c556
MMKRAVFALAALAVGMTAVAAQDVIAERKELMKKSGAQGKIGQQMIKGEAPFDLAKAQGIFTVYLEKASKMRTLFPESSKSGETRALPAIWEKSAEWIAAIEKFEADAKAAQAAAKDAASFKTAFETVGKNCGGCHRVFRKPQS